jgi:hypothetical protein
LPIPLKLIYIKNILFIFRRSNSENGSISSNPSKSKFDFVFSTFWQIMKNTIEIFHFCLVIIEMSTTNSNNDSTPSVFNTTLMSLGKTFPHTVFDKKLIKIDVLKLMVQILLWM